MDRSPTPAGVARGAEPASGGFEIHHDGRVVSLEPGQYVIGRSPSADIVVDDALASRHHARLLVNDTTVVVEDLRSENGVYVNDHRIRRSVRLEDGDRVGIGAAVLTCRSVGPRSAWTSGTMTAVSPGPRPLLALGSSGPDLVSTLEADAFQHLGGLADRMLAAGRGRTAERMLATHLQDLLDAARRGLPVERALVDAASPLALKLAHALGEAAWVNYVLELHVILALPLCADATARLAQMVQTLPAGSHSLFAGYQRALSASLHRLGAADAALARAVMALRLTPT